MSLTRVDQLVHVLCEPKTSFINTYLARAKHWYSYGLGRQVLIFQLLFCLCHFLHPVENASPEVFSFLFLFRYFTLSLLCSFLSTLWSSPLNYSAHIHRRPCLILTCFWYKLQETIWYLNGTTAFSVKFLFCFPFPFIPGHFALVFTPYSPSRIPIPIKAAFNSIHVPGYTVFSAYALVIVSPCTSICCL